MVQLLGEPVRMALPDELADVYFIVPKLIVIFGFTEREDHPL
jgi:hypothetical protein